MYIKISSTSCKETQPNTGKKLSGVVGLEPTNSGVKVRCLTTWLHPKILSYIMRIIVIIQIVKNAFLLTIYYFSSLFFIRIS